MKLFVAIGLTALVSATPDPLITPRAELKPRQDTDPALLGWVSSSGASEFNDQRSCDFPQTLSRSGSLAQCCGTTGPCPFYSSCSAGALFAGSSSVFCDQGFCNTAVIVPTTGASSGQSFLGCWATSLGEEPFTIVQDIGSAPIGVPSTSARSSSASEDSDSSSRSPTRTSGSGSSGTASSTAAAESTGGAAMAASEPLAGVVGAAAILYAML